MRLGELLGVEVVDEHGTPVGKVHDVRLEQADPELAGVGPCLRVEGLIVGRRALGARFGFGRGGVQGPWLLKVVFGPRATDATCPGTASGPSRPSRSASPAPQATSRDRNRPMHRAGPGSAGGRLQRAGPIPRWVRLEWDGWYRPAGPRANTRSRFTVTLRTTLAVSTERRGSAQARLS
jgi:hypothetical protein